MALTGWRHRTQWRAAVVLLDQKLENLWVHTDWKIMISTLKPWDLQILEVEQGGLYWKGWCRAHFAHRPQVAEQHKIPDKTQRDQVSISSNILTDALKNYDTFTCLSKKPLPSGSAKSQIWEETVDNYGLWISKYHFWRIFALIYPNTNLS